MSSNLNQFSDFQFAQQLQAMLAAQNNGTQQNIGGALRNVEAFGGAGNGQFYNSGEFGRFDRTSIPAAAGPSSAIPAPAPSSSAASVDYILRIVAQADQNTLLRSGNDAYARILESHNGTKEELESLKYA